MSGNNGLKSLVTGEASFGQVTQQRADGSSEVAQGGSAPAACLKTSRRAGEEAPEGSAAQTDAVLTCPWAN